MLCLLCVWLVALWLFWTLKWVLLAYVCPEQTGRGTLGMLPGRYLSQCHPLGMVLK